MVMTVAMPAACGALTPVCFLRHKSLLSSKSSLTSSPLLSPSPPALSSHASSSRIVQARSESEERASTGAFKKQLVVGILAAGVVLTGTDVGMAFTGSGSKGAESTSQKATELLKSADKLTKDEAPKRFGPGQLSSSIEDSASSAQKAGGGAIEGLQSSGTEAIDSAKKNLESTKTKIGGIFGNAEEKSEGVSDVAAGKASETKEKAQGILDQSSESAANSKGLLGSIQETFQNLKENVVQRGEDTLNTAEK